MNKLELERTINAVFKLGEDVNSYERLLLIALAVHDYETGENSHTVSQLAEHCNMRECQAKLILGWMKAHGLVSVIGDRTIPTVALADVPA